MYKVLLVDDEKIVKMALRNVIPWEQYGFTITGSASDGQEALLQIEKIRPHIVITDMKMPNMDGLSLIRAMKDRGIRAKIIVISNYDEFEMVKEALRLGASDYILKMSLKKETFIEQLLRISQEMESEIKMEEYQRQEKNKTERYIKDMEVNLIRDIIQNPGKALDGLLQSQFGPFALLMVSIEKKENADVRTIHSAIKSIIENAFDAMGQTDIVLADQNSITFLLKEKALKEAGVTIEYYSKRCRDLLEIYLQMKSKVVYTAYMADYDAIIPQYEYCRNLIGHASRKSAEHQEIAKLIGYIKENIETKFTLSKLTSYVNMNESYLCRVFKKQTGKSMFHYINGLKMERAKEYLLHSDMNIKYISSCLGIDDQLYFSRLFKKQFGLSPSEFRNRNAALPSVPVSASAPAGIRE